MDADSGLVHTVETIATHVHMTVSSLLQGENMNIYGDSGYFGSESKDAAV